METALAGSDLATFPDYPAEIRAPAGTTFGVSSFQIHFGSQDILTAGDMLDVLVAMNPAALITNIKDLAVGGLVVLDTGAFNARNLEKAGYAENPIGTDALAPYRVLPLDITRLTQAAVKDHGVSSKEALRCRNMWALGLMLWMYDRDHAATVTWLKRKFAKAPADRGGQHRRAECGQRLRRNRRDAGPYPGLRGAPRRSGARNLSRGERDRGARVRTARRGQEGGTGAALLRIVSHHSGVRVCSTRLRASATWA